jgi:hypothetical protein
MSEISKELVKYISNHSLIRTPRWQKLYTEKTAITAADMLNDRVIPFFDEQEVPLLRILTDRGTEFCGGIENYAYELFLSVEEIERSKTKAYGPGICERFHKTMKNEFYDSA